MFGRVTGFAELDEAVARILANKDDLLRVLDRPDIPLNTNTSETDGAQLRHQTEDQWRDPVHSRQTGARYLPQPLKTCAKHAISFWDYLGARLKIPDAGPVPWLPDLIRQPASA